MRISAIFNNNFSITSTGVNVKQKTPRAKSPSSLPKRQNEGDVFIKNYEVKRNYDKHGNVSLEAVYKDGKSYRDIWFDPNGKMQWVRYYDGSLNLSRNAWHDWKKAPCIELEKEENGKTTMLHAKPATRAKGDFKGEVGGYSLSIWDENGDCLRAELFANPDGTFNDYGESNLPVLKTALEELLELIGSKEYVDSFGGSYKFNDGVEKAIKYIEKKEN